MLPFSGFERGRGKSWLLPLGAWNYKFLPWAHPQGNKAYGVRKVFLFGSVKDASLIPKDIDLAVEGLEDENFYKAVFDVQGLAECRVDIVAVEDLSPRFRQLISETGELLYESPELGR